MLPARAARRSLAGGSLYKQAPLKESAADAETFGSSCDSLDRQDVPLTLASSEDEREREDEVRARR